MLEKASRKRFLYFLSFILLTSFVILVEGISFLIFSNIENKYYNYESIIKFHNKVKFFKVIEKNGEEYLYSKFFPTEYYSSYRRERKYLLKKNKDENVFRIFAYGGSSTAGSPYGSWASFVVNLKEQLDLIKKKNIQIEIMNFGVSSIGSTKVAEIFKKTIKYKPDLAIVYTGHNEFSDFITRSLGERKKSIYINVYNWSLRNINLIKLINLLMSQISPVKKTITYKSMHKVDANLQDSINENSFKIAKRELLSMYNENIQKIAKTAKKNNTTTLFLSQPANELYQPTSVAKVMNKNDSFDSQVEVSLKKYLKGLQELKENKESEAKSFLLEAIENDPTPDRFKPSYKKILKDIHDVNSSIYYIDSEAFLRLQINNGVFDGRLLVDKVHLNITGYKLIAKAILEQFFLKEGFRRDLFNYDNYDERNLWKINILPTDYSKVCARYFRKKYRGPSWGNCIKLFENKYISSDDIAQKRINLRYWEFLYYYGLSIKNREYVDVSKKIYDHPNIDNF